MGPLKRGTGTPLQTMLLRYRFRGLEKKWLKVTVTQGVSFFGFEVLFDQQYYVTSLQ